MAENLWALRDQKKISVATLASRAGLPIALIMEYESGQRSIDPRHLNRIARALYVEESAIKLQSDPRPGAGKLERQPIREPERPTGPRPAMAPPPKPREKQPRPKAEPRPPAPARPSQIAHLDMLLQRLKRTRSEIEAQIGKPLESLDRPSMAELLKQLQAELKAVPTPERHRAYLPEAVDEFEARYLSQVQEAGDGLHFSLFDGSTLEGQVIGFGPYSITVRLADGSETTLNKLALVSYRRLPATSAPAAQGGG